MKKVKINDKILKAATRAGLSRGHALSWRLQASNTMTTLSYTTEHIPNKLASLRSQGWGTPLYINMEIS